MKALNILALATCVALASCGGNESTTTNPTTSSSTPAAKPSTSVTPEVVDGKIPVTITANDDMKFNVKEVKVKKDVPVVLTLEHTGKAPVTTMGHNIVVLQKGTDVPDFVNKANAAKDNGYIPTDDAAKQVIAKTKMLGGGEKDNVEFTFTEPGEYIFLCSFPGHSGMMKGKFIVE